MHFLFSILILMAFPYLSPEKEDLIPRSALFSNPDYKNPKISPDGQYFAYLAPNSNQVLNIWVQELGSKEAIQVTDDNLQGIKDFKWQKDSRHILYIQDVNGNHNNHIYQANLFTRRSRDLTPFEGVQATILSLSSAQPNKALVSINKRDKRCYDAYLLDLEEGTLSLAYENTGDITDYVADDKLRIKAVMALTDSGHSIVRVKKEEKWEDFLTFPPEDYGTSILGLKKDEPVIYLRSYVGNNTLRLFEYNIDTKESKILYEHPKYDMQGILCHPKSKAIQAVNFYGDRFDWGFIDANIKEHFQILKQLPGDIYVISRDDVDKHWIIAYENDDRPKEYYLYQTNSKKLVRLFSEKESLLEYSFVKVKPIHFQARDGMTIQGYFAKPEKKGKHPLVIYVHGGAWSRDRWGFSPVIQWLANRGYAVLQVNYRGSCGFGKEYTLAGKRQLGKKRHTDLLDGKNWLVNQGLVDSEKVAIAGSSLGGYAALVGMTFTPDEFCCGISHVGPTNLVSFLKTLPPSFHAMKSIIRFFIGDPEREASLLKEQSPLFKVNRIKKPLLIAQGAWDPIVPKKESDQLVEAMREQNLPVQYLLFPNEGHSINNTSNRLKYFAAFESFLSEHLGGKLQYVEKEEKWDELFK